MPLHARRGIQIQDLQIEESCEFYLQKITDRIDAVEAKLESKVNVLDIEESLTFTAANIAEMVEKQVAAFRKELCGDKKGEELEALKTEVHQLVSRLDQWEKQGGEGISEAIKKQGKWTDIVTKEVENRMQSMTVEVTALQQDHRYPKGQRGTGGDS